MSENNEQAQEPQESKANVVENTGNETEKTEKEKENKTPKAEGAQKSSFGTKPAFKEQFKAFSKFGDTKSDGKHITLSQSDKWMKQAKVIDGKKITTTDTGIHFKKFKSLKISFEDYKKFVENLAQSKKVDLEEIETKLSTCGAPGLHGVASLKNIPPLEYLKKEKNHFLLSDLCIPDDSKTLLTCSDTRTGSVYTVVLVYQSNAKIDSTIERLTDVSKYTGSHKQRFDDSGKGKGIAGRKDIVDNSGYVSGYQNKDTYSKTH